MWTPAGDALTPKELIPGQPALKRAPEGAGQGGLLELGPLDSCLPASGGERYLHSPQFQRRGGLGHHGVVSGACFPSVFWKSMACRDSRGQVEKILRLDQVKGCQRERASQRGGWLERASGWTSAHGGAWCWGRGRAIRLLGSSLLGEKFRAELRGAEEPGPGLAWGRGTRW